MVETGVDQWIPHLVSVVSCVGRKSEDVANQVRKKPFLVTGVLRRGSWGDSEFWGIIGSRGNGYWNDELWMSDIGYRFSSRFGYETAIFVCEENEMTFKGLLDVGQYLCNSPGIWGLRPGFPK